MVDKFPQNIETINRTDSADVRGSKLINNSIKRENYQREMAINYLKNIEDEDVVLINDIDEIPNLDKISFNSINKKIIIFKQKTYYYKFNLRYENLIWHGSRACKKKNFLSPQWLRNVKHRKYPFWRFDMYFSKKKYNNIHYVEDGGWHFTNIKSPENLQKKFSNFLHHQDFEASGLKLNDIKEKIENNKILYDLNVDQRDYKWGGNKTLTQAPVSEMPKYLSDNYSKYSGWFKI